MLGGGGIGVQLGGGGVHMGLDAAVQRAPAQHVALVELEHVQAAPGAGALAAAAERRLSRR